jgi:hypothetical protein
MLKHTNHVKSYEILCILGYKKMTYYVVNSTHFNAIYFCQNLLFLYSLQYKGFHIETLYGL